MEDAENMETMGKKYLKSTFLRDFVRVRNESSPSAFLYCVSLMLHHWGRLAA